MSLSDIYTPREGYDSIESADLQETQLEFKLKESIEYLNRLSAGLIQPGIL